MRRKENGESSIMKELVVFFIFTGKINVRSEKKGKVPFDSVQMVGRRLWGRINCEFIQILGEYSFSDSLVV